MSAKRILPWFGGTPSVWTTCMLFYQVLLLLGYIYAHIISTKIKPRFQILLHLLVLGLVFLFFVIAAYSWKYPTLPDSSWKPNRSGKPSWQILQLLGASIGFPFFLLSSTSPLLQKWLTSALKEPPYKLYALSNIGSLLGLISYPFLIEPNFSLKLQSIAWSAFFILFIGLSAICSLRMKPTIVLADKTIESPPLKRVLLWISLAACGSLMLLATTNQICREIAVVPFLWVLPLTLYLLTFILCFQGEKYYPRIAFHLVLGPTIILAYLILSNGISVPLWQQIVVFSGTLFITGMICHGELYRLRPGRDQLTTFYVSVAAGGAFGGVLSAVVAPYVMKGFWEFHLGLWLTSFLLIIALFDEKNSWVSALNKRQRPIRFIQFVLLLSALAFLLLHEITQELKGTIYTARNFYGVVSVLKEDAGTPDERYTLRHGRIDHGYQFTDQERMMVPAGYYSPISGFGLSLQLLRDRGNLRIGSIGLGVGMIAAYGQRGDSIRFYEIDPEIIRLAQSGHKYFQFIARSPAKIDVTLGDGRISLEREPPQNFDLLAIDAFSSDSIPAHLLTREATEIYRKHVKKPSGILAFNITNRYLNLRPVIFGVADHFRLKAVEIDAPAERHYQALSSQWILMSADENFILPAQLIIKDPSTNRRILWTDDDHSLFPLVKKSFTGQ
jgi:hypothetical protein